MSASFIPTVYTYYPPREIKQQGDLNNIDDVQRNLNRIENEIRIYEESRMSPNELRYSVNYLNLKSLADRLNSRIDRLNQEEEEERQRLIQEEEEERQRLNQEEEEERQRQIRISNNANRTLDFMLNDFRKFPEKNVSSQARSVIIKNAIKITNDMLDQDMDEDEIQVAIEDYIENYLLTNNNLSPERGSGLSYKGKYHGYIRNISRMAKGL